MEDNYKKLFGYINLIEPPKGFEAQILRFINLKEKRATRFNVLVFGSTSLTSFGLSLWAGIYLVKSVKETGFGQYFSLIFWSDSTVYAYWKELGIALVESLPIVGIILFLVASGFLIWSFTKIWKTQNNQKQFGILSF
jgi:hypothetical protein